MRGERGSGSMLALMGVAVLIPLVIGALAISSLWLARERAAGAADLAALAAASAMGAGQDPCSAAVRMVEANGATLRSCSLEGLSVVVETEVRVPAPFGVDVPVPAISRAGPTVAR